MHQPRGDMGLKSTPGENDIDNLKFTCFLLSVNMYPAHTLFHIGMYHYHKSVCLNIRQYLKREWDDSFLRKSVSRRSLREIDRHLVCPEKHDRNGVR